MIERLFLVIFTIAILTQFTLCDHHINLLRAVNHPDIIEEINSHATTWEAGVNERFENMTLAEVKHLLGALETPEDRKLPIKNILAFPIENLPEHYDLREAFPECQSLREIRDQSNCGSCWAFGAAEAMSDRICIASKGKLQTRISAEHILSCCKSCGFGCDGGFPAAAWSFWESEGVPSGGLYNDTQTCKPYSFPPCDHHVVGKYGPCGKEEFPTPTCAKTCTKGYPKSLEDDKTFASSSYSVPAKEEAIMSEIMTHGSVEVAFSVYEDFLNYKSGIYQHVKGHSLGGHAIKMIGWGVENGVKYWILVNSWNDGWGEKGTFRILRGADHCGIESEVVAGVPKCDTDENIFEQTK